MSRSLSLYNLPGDIYDDIAAFLPDKDLYRFLTLSPHITVSAYLLRARQRAYWKKCGAEHLAEKGDLAGLQFLHSIGAPFTTKAMNWAAHNGHLAVVQFLHSIGGTYTIFAINNAAMNGHLAVVQFLHSVGAPYTPSAVTWAAENGHLAVVQFLHSIGAPLYPRDEFRCLSWALARGRVFKVQL